MTRLRHAGLLAGLLVAALLVGAPAPAVSGWGPQKPVLGTPLNWSHPLAQGLVFAALFNEHGGAIALDGRSGKSGTFTNTPTWSDSTGMGSVDFAGTAYIPWAGIPDAPFLGPITLVWRGVIDTGSAYRYLAGKHVDNGATATPFQFGTSNDATPIIALGRAGAGDRWHGWNGPAVTLGVYQQYAVVSTSGLIETVPTFYINGTPTTGSEGGGSATPTGAATGTEADLRIGRRHDGVSQMDGRCSLFLAYSRALSSEELYALYRDPYAMWAPPARSRWPTR